MSMQRWVGQLCLLFYHIWNCCITSSHHWHKLQTGSLLLALHFIRTRFQWYHTHSNSRAISPASKQILSKELSLALFSYHCLLMMHAAHIFNIDTSPCYHSFTSLPPFLSLSPFSLSFCLSWCLFGCWVLFVYCFQMADADFICVAFKFPESFLLPWLKRLSCFL